MAPSGRAHVFLPPSSRIKLKKNWGLRGGDRQRTELLKLSGQLHFVGCLRVEVKSSGLRRGFARKDFVPGPQVPEVRGNKHPLVALRCPAPGEGGAVRKRQQPGLLLSALNSKTQAWSSMAPQLSHLYAPLRLSCQTDTALLSGKKARSRTCLDQPEHVCGGTASLRQVLWSV